LSEANVLAERINHLIGQYQSNSLARLTDATPQQLWAAVRPMRSKGVDFLGGLLKNADSANKYFASIATNISYSIDNVLKYKAPDISLHLVEEYISCYEVERLLRLQKNTSPGCDLLPNWLMRSCSFELASLVAHIYNCSIHSGIVPISWHTAIVTPVPKVSALASLNDYRPISVTPILSRIAEKFIVKHFIRPAIPRDAILDQFAFKPSGSTTCALVGLQHHVTYEVG